MKAGHSFTIEPMICEGRISIWLYKHVSSCTGTVVGACIGTVVGTCAGTIVGTCTGSLVG